MQTRGDPAPAARDTPAWTPVTTAGSFSPRDTAEPLVFRDAMWLSNGYVEGGRLVRDLWRSQDGIDWTRISDHTPYDGYSEMVVFRDRIWAVKGSVWSSTDGETWAQACGATPFGPRGYGELVVFKDRMWQLGSGRDVWYSEDGAQWTCALADAPYGPRFGSAVAVYQDRLWLLGGATEAKSDPPETHYPQFTTHHDVWCSEDGIEWACVREDAPWPPRMWTVAAVYADALWVLGGFSNRRDINFADAWYTVDGMAWQAAQSDPMFSPRHEVSPYVFRGALWVVAGNAWPLTNDVWRLALPNAGWSHPGTGNGTARQAAEPSGNAVDTAHDEA